MDIDRILDEHITDVSREEEFIKDLWDNDVNNI